MKEATDPIPTDPADNVDDGPKPPASDQRFPSPFADLQGPRRVANWIVHLKKVEDRLAVLSDDRQKIEYVTSLTRANAALVGRNHSFVRVMARWFAHAAIVEIAALFDRDKRSYSARHVLIDALQAPHLVTYESFVAAESDEAFPRMLGRCRWSDLGEECWNETWGDGDKKVVRRLLCDALKSVNATRERLADYRNRVVAHLDRSGDVEPPKLPTFGEVFETVDAVLSAYSKVRILFVGGSLGHTTDISDWTDIFEVPWISPPSDG